MTRERFEEWKRCRALDPDIGTRIIGDPGEGWLAILGSRRKFTPNAVKWFIGFCEGYWEIEPDDILDIQPTYMCNAGPGCYRRSSFVHEEPGWWRFCDKDSPGAVPATCATLR